MKTAIIINISEYPEQLTYGQSVDVIEELEDQIIVHPHDDGGNKFDKEKEFYEISASDVIMSDRAFDFKYRNKIIRH